MKRKINVINAAIRIVTKTPMNPIVSNLINKKLIFLNKLKLNKKKNCSCQH